ncbi:MAG: carotenoid biosynthesis protein [Herpetosiphonaceae bacterium]|nr:carotenoid biosynthesis protein [Herpetosiphonaceae bacterium]
MYRLRSYPILDRAVVALFGVYLFIYLFALPMLIFDLVPAWGTWMGGFLLILQGSMLLLWLVGEHGVRGGVAALLIAGLAFLVEYVGVTTGWPFGHYRYTPILGLKLLGAVPLPIPFAWLMVVPAALGISQRLSRGWWQLWVAGLLALGLDLLIEPVAAYVVQYWTWLDSGPYYGVPTANFVAWGTTALLLAALCIGLTGARRGRRRMLGWLPAVIYLLNLVQFMLVDLAHGYWAAALIGAVLLLVVGRAYHSERLLAAQQLT